MAEQPDNKRPQNQPNQGKPGVPAPKAPRGLFSMLSILALILLGGLLLSTMQTSATRVASWAEFRNLVAAKSVQKVEIHDDGVYALKTGDDGRTSTVYFPISPATKADYTKEVRDLTGGNYTEVAAAAWKGLLITFLPILLMLGIVW
ncbi:MAG: ATP-dependent metallopeptidase FtsH/Yme1/Tma family protein, partial [Phycisphaerales bacterium]|nr:ATP-dependent metallopeptidase FtsH/Yme1/Tma family protein [Phycisphaerales bacterium]